MICPRCGSFISPGEVCCPECGATFKVVENTGDDVNDYRFTLRLNIAHSIRKGEYKRALELLGELDEYEDVSVQLEPVRKHYIEVIVRHMGDGEHGTANLLFG